MDFTETLYAPKTVNHNLTKSTEGVFFQFFS